MHPQLNAVVQGLQDNAPAITYTGGTSALVFYGLHISDIGIIVSMFATLAGVFLQVYVTMHKMRMLERDQKESERLALIAAGRGIAADLKSAENSARITALEKKVDAVKEQLTVPPPQA